jgi:Protein of unknown function (DUF1353)
VHSAKSAENRHERDPFRGLDEVVSMPFLGDSRPLVKQISDRDWEVAQTLTYRGESDEFVVPTGMPTDFASVPRPFVWFLPRYGRYTRAAILHDYLWRFRVGSDTQPVSRRDADGLFRRVMRELNVPFLRRWIMWGAVRWAALFKPDGRKGWLRDAPKVLLVTIVAVPVVLPPAILVIVSLGVFYVLEMLLVLPLKVGRALRMKATKNEPRKAVAVPTFDWSSS